MSFVSTDIPVFWVAHVGRPVAGNPENLSTTVRPERKGLRLISTEHLCNIQLTFVNLL